jgi:hypothetical protein
MEWDKKIPSRLNRRATTESSHLTGQVGQVGQADLRRFSQMFLKSYLTAKLKADFQLD